MDVVHISASVPLHMKLKKMHTVLTLYKDPNPRTLVEGIQERAGTHFHNKPYNIASITKLPLIRPA